MPVSVSGYVWFCQCLSVFRHQSFSVVQFDKQLFRPIRTAEYCIRYCNSHIDIQITRLHQQIEFKFNPNITFIFAKQGKHACKLSHYYLPCNCWPGNVYISVNSSNFSRNRLCGNRCHPCGRATHPGWRSSRSAQLFGTEISQWEVLFERPLVHTVERGVRSGGYNGLLHTETQQGNVCGPGAHFGRDAHHG